jgi:branched-chain amino acid transport system ATP-binding protein
MDAVFELADRLTVMQDGRVIASGSPNEVRRDPAVRAAYLGTHGDAA